LRQAVEDILRQGLCAANGSAVQPGLSDAEIALCFEYSAGDTPIDLQKLLPRPKSPDPAAGKADAVTARCKKAMEFRSKDGEAYWRLTNAIGVLTKALARQSAFLRACRQSCPAARSSRFAERRMS